MNNSQRAAKARVCLGREGTAQGCICCASRDVTSERQLYPSFAPEDFPAVFEASQAALAKAQELAMQQPNSQVGRGAEGVVRCLPRVSPCAVLCGGVFVIFTCRLLCRKQHTQP